MSFLPKFIDERSSLRYDQHQECYEGCADVEDDLINCQNNVKRCTKATHLLCANLAHPSTKLLRFWYCRSCLEGDPTGGLKSKLDEEFKLAKLSWELAYKHQNGELSCDKCEANEAELKKSCEKAEALKKELTKSTEKLEECNKLIEEQANEIMSLKEMMSQATTSSNPVNPARNVQFSPATETLLNTSRTQRKTRDSVTFNIPSDLHSTRASMATGNITLADMALVYPDYDKQEQEADQMRLDQLKMIRSCIAKPPEFKGDAVEWATFKTTFVTTSERGHFRRVEDMERLRTLIKGEALKMYESEISNPLADPIEILKQLDYFYGYKGNPLRNQLKIISDLKRLERAYDKEGLLKLFSNVKRYALLCRQFKQESELKAESSLYVIEARMFTDHVTEWRRWVEKNHFSICVDGLASFLEDRLKRINERPELDKGAKASHIMSHRQENQPNSSNFKRNKRPLKCFHCSEEHPLRKCPLFAQANHDERNRIIKNLKVCGNCLAKRYHTPDTCRVETVKCPIHTCTIPKLHPLLHGHANGLIKELIFAGVHVMSMEPSAVTTYYRILPGHVVSADGKRIPITIMCDTGAGLSLSEKSLLRKAKLESTPKEIALKWTNDVVRTENDAALFDIKFIPQGKSFAINLKNLIAIDNLSLPEQHQNPDEIKRKFSYLQKVPLPAFKNQKPQILLGLPHSALICSLQTVRGPGSGPVAELSELGWSIGGSCSENWNVELIKEPLIIGCMCTDSQNENESVDPLMKLVKFHFSLDSLGITATKPGSYSMEDVRAEQMLTQTLTFLPEHKRYQARLLWKDDDCQLPNNYELAKSRLISSENRLIKLGIADQIRKQFQEEIENGQMVKVSPEELKSQKRVNYLPGFVTFNKNKVPVKARWVHDPASEFKKVSLNKMLMKGPDNLVALPKAICALREEAIAYTADVKSMFNQILIAPEDQYAQLSLWRDCDPTKEPETYKQTRLIFGPKCSPSIANAVRLTHAEKNKDKFPEACDVAINQMYMDDGLDSRETVQEATRVAYNLIDLFDMISWALVQFQSNSRDFLQSLPPWRVSDKLVEIGEDLSDEITTKVLGIFWQTSNDCFVFRLNDTTLLNKCKLNAYTPNRKELLGLIMRMFDPMGFVAHFLVRGRLILQELCRRNLNWKQKIPSDLLDKWQKWLGEFDQVSKLSIPRRYIQRPLKDGIITFHMFGDASTEAYAAAVYIRIDFGDEVYVRLVVGKSRVAPIKYVSVPRLELMAALIGVRLLTAAMEWQRRLKATGYYCWSDSLTVLRWIMSRNVKLTQFVGPRVSQIHEGTAVHAWNYVPSKKNVADLGTKWIEFDFSDATSEWYHGPKFLYLPQSEWPQLPDDLRRPSANEMEVVARKSDVTEHVLLTKPLDLINPWQAGILVNVSASIRADWAKLTRVVARALRFKDKISKGGDGKGNKNFISPDELERAENYLIREVQMYAYKEEWTRFNNGKKLKSSSSIISLSPFFCPSTRLIRVRTRLSENFPYNFRFPPLLPNMHELSDAIVRYYHEKHNHVGDNKISGEIRSRVWIVNLRRASRRCRARCLHCIHERSKPAVPLTAPLPDFRQVINQRPFCHVGVDCFGPLETYVGRSKHKKNVFVIIFTCLNTRAVYMEVLHDMTDDSVITAIEKLWARRGPVSHFYSDGGLNFKGASNMINACSNELKEKFRDKFEEMRCEWHFNPPYAPHFGGIWERLIKDVKRSLEASIKKFPVKEIVLESALAQIEGHMNDRPLTDVAISPDDQEPVTPNLLIRGYNNHPQLMNYDVRQIDVLGKCYVKSAKALVQTYMKRWIHEVLPEIAKHRLQKKPEYELKVGDFVVYINPSKLPSQWDKGVVCDVHPGRDGGVRIVDVKVSSNKVLTRLAATRLAKIDFCFDHPAAEQKNYTRHLNLMRTENLNLHSEQTQEKSKKNTKNSTAQRKTSETSTKMASTSVLTGYSWREIVHGDDDPNFNLTNVHDRTIFFSNFPDQGGIFEIFISFQFFDEIEGIIVRRWTGNDSFSGFVVFKSTLGVKKAVSYSQCYAILVDRKFHRINFETVRKNFKFAKFVGRKRFWATLGLNKAKVKVIIGGITNDVIRPIPLSCGHSIVLRDCDHPFKYNFNEYESTETDQQNLVTIPLPTIKVSEAKRDVSINRSGHILISCPMPSSKGQLLSEDHANLISDDEEDVIEEVPVIRTSYYVNQEDIKCVRSVVMKRRRIRRTD